MVIDAAATWVTLHAALSAFNVVALALAALGAYQAFTVSKRLHYIAACMGLMIFALGDVVHLLARFDAHSLSLWGSESSIVLGCMFLLLAYGALGDRRANEGTDSNGRVVAALTACFAAAVFAWAILSIIAYLGVWFPPLTDPIGPSHAYVILDMIIIILFLATAGLAAVVGGEESRTFRALLAAAMVVSATARLLFIGSATFYDLSAWAGHGVRTLAGLVLLWTYLARYGELRRAATASVARFHTLFETVAQPILVVDARTSAFIEVNRAAEDFYGYPRDQFLSLSLRDIRPPADPDHPEAAADADGDAIGVEQGHVTREGNVRYVHCSAAAVDYDGRSAQVIVVSDMTARRQLEDELRQSQADLSRRNEEQRQLLQLATDVYRSLDLAQRLEAVIATLVNGTNAACVAIIMLEPSRGTIRVMARRRLAGAGGARAEYTLPVAALPTVVADVMAPGAEPRLCDLTQVDLACILQRPLWEASLGQALCVPVTQGTEAIGMLLLAWDAPDASRGPEETAFCRAVASQASAAIANARLFDDVRRSEALHRATIEEAGRGIVIADESGIITDANQEACALLGYTRDELVGQCAPSLKSGQPIADTLRELSREPDGGGRRDVTTTLQRGDGSSFPAEISAVIVRGGPQTRYLAIIQDLTEHREREKRLLQAERLRALGQVASGIAHDIKNTLNVVLGWAELGLERTTQADVRHALEIIRQASADGAQTLLRIQQFSREHAPGPQVEVDINRAVIDVVEASRPRWQRIASSQGAGVEVRTELGDVPRVAFNPAELREILMNLVLNACDALPDGGAITIRTYGMQGAAYIEVCDTGTGISPEVEKHIFEPFFTTKGAENSGLGLAVSRGIIERQGGEIMAESTPGKGTTMRICLPHERDVQSQAEPVVAPPADAQVAESAAQVDVGRGHRRVDGEELDVLLVDDDGGVLEMLQLALEHRGHRVRCAHTGGEALSAMECAELDVVITDLGLPDLTGWQVAETARMRFPGAYLMLLTGWANVDGAAYPFVDRVLGKPLPLPDLYEAIDGAMVALRSR